MVTQLEGNKQESLLVDHYLYLAVHYIECVVRHGCSPWIASNSSEVLYLKYLSMTLKVITIRSVARYDWVGLHEALTR